MEVGFIRVVFGSYIKGLDYENNNRHVLTLWNRKEHDERDCITMGTSHRVVHVSQGHIKWVKVILTGSNRDSCLVTTENYWDERRTMCRLVLRNFIL